MQTCQVVSSSWRLFPKLFRNLHTDFFFLHGKICPSEKTPPNPCGKHSAVSFPLFQAPRQSYRALFSKVKQFLPPLYRRNKIIQTDNGGKYLLFILLPHRKAEVSIMVMPSVWYVSYWRNMKSDLI